MEILYVLLAIAIIVGFYVVAVYNRLARSLVRMDEAWSQIDVQLKRRVDLIPNLVETVKGYAAHEKEVFQRVTEARSALMSASSVSEAEEADIQLTTALKSLFAVAEAYPELKAQEGFINLQKELSDTEDKVAYSRQFYNSVVRDYNSMIVTFPTSVIAGIFGYDRKPFFEVKEEEREAIKVDFS